ncbi:MAG TPA: hypothetical protein VI819_02710 [Patescibacteria group bacterium]|nr:hypothetical protein [Patescibacteria group bacterium]
MGKELKRQLNDSVTPFEVPPGWDYLGSVTDQGITYFEFSTGGSYIFKYYKCPVTGNRRFTREDLI